VGIPGICGNFRHFWKTKNKNNQKIAYAMYQVDEGIA